MFNLLALLCGLLAAALFPSLPNIPIYSLLLVFALLCVPKLRVVGFLCIGLWWGILNGQHLIRSQLPTELEGVDIDVIGDIIDLPQQREVGQRFLFRVESIQGSNTQEVMDSWPVPSNILITDYDDTVLEVGQRWQLRVRLKRPRALVNEGGFDYQRWLLSRRISATGYIRATSENRQLQPIRTYPLQRMRANIRDWILTSAPPTTRGPLVALVIGENNEISPTQWQMFRATGTGHLLAISGMHIGLIALFGFFLGRGLSTLVTLVFAQKSWLRLLPSIFSCTFSCIYAALAGFELPTQRALVMVLMVNLALLWGRGHQPLRVLVLAAVVVLLLDPLAGFDIGFWLSFGAVTVLITYFQYRRSLSSSHKLLLRKIQIFITAQAVVFAGLILPLLVFNTQLTLLSPFANAVVIPLVSFFAVIPLFVATVVHILGFEVAQFMLEFSSLALELCFDWLAWLQSLSLPSLWSPNGPAVSWSLVAVAVGGICLILMGKGFPGRWLGALLVVPVLFPSSTPLPPLMVSVLDVGQGLAIVVRTPNHTLLYDTGAHFSERFDTGDAIVVPFLRVHGINHIDTLIISHRDNDHAGGANAVLNAVAVDKIILGEALPNLSVTSQLCDKNARWQWQQVTFQLLEPAFISTHGDNNNESCVVLISYADQYVLLPGDIEAPVERALLASNELPHPLQTVIAPHHGSNTSSTQAFIDYTQPRQVIFSAAYRSRYGHPHKLVTQRYRNSGADLYNTATAGQIDLVWNEAGQLSIKQLRQAQPKYWYGD